MRPAARQGVRHASPSRGSQESRSSQEPGRHLRPGRRQPAGSRLPAPFQRVRSPGPADRVQPSLLRLTGDMVPSQKHFQKVLEMEAPEDLRGLHGMGYARWRPANSRPGGRGRTAVFYPAGHDGSFAGGCWRSSRRSPPRSECWGITGWTSTTPGRRTFCGHCRGGRSRRWSCCASCTPGLQRIESGMDIGKDLGEEWGMAEKLRERWSDSESQSFAIYLPIGSSVSIYYSEIKSRWLSVV